MMAHPSIFLLFICLSLPLVGSAQDCTCTNCPQFMPDLFTGDFVINIQGATNNTLGANGQAVCGVRVTWDHTAICDISITLTAPSGQAVTLVGPIGQFCQNMGNNGTIWDVTFVPCSDAALPDPGFAAQWNNNQNWGSNNNYSGSYYPFAGCLENLTGPVNGNWVLTVVDGQANDVGNLLNFEVIFCDPSGINCISCVADAGALLQGDVVACESAAELALDLPPTYAPPAVAPPSSEYSYAYVIAGAGGIIQAISGSPDMSGYAAGNYTICGLSYFSGHQGLLPMPNGFLTIAQLNGQLNSNTPPFCGNMTSNCVSVSILPLPPDVDEFVEICSPNCYDFLGQFYCQTGVYIVPQTDANGCPFNATLHLTVNPPSLVNVNEVICDGECSQNPNFPDACSPGTYTAILTNALGCDSIITLNLSINNPVAIILPPDTLSCNQPSVTLFGSGSSLGANVSYLWTASNGGNLVGPVNQLNATADAPGSYQLRVCRNAGNALCCDSATTVVFTNSTLPIQPIVLGPATVCLDSIVQLTTLGTQVADWQVPVGISVLSSLQTDTLLLRWDSLFQANICATLSNSCGVSPPGCLMINAFPAPDTPALAGLTQACRNQTLIYSVDSIPGADYYLWNISGGSLLTQDSSRQQTVLWDQAVNAGTVCVQAVNDCGRSDTVCLNVQIDDLPVIGPINGDSLICAGTTSNYLVLPVNGITDYSWSIPPDAVLLSGQQSNEIQIDWSNSLGGLVCVSVNSNCGNTQPVCLNVVVAPLPMANAGPDQVLCGDSTQLMAIPTISGSAGQWILFSGPGVLSFSAQQSPVTALNTNTSGTFGLIWAESIGSCIDFDTIQITFNPLPQTGAVQHICDASNQNYTVGFPISGGTSPFTVSGGQINGAVFSSDPISSGQPYQFVVTDANGCAASTVSGVFNCNCSTSAGQMAGFMLEVCAGDSITAVGAQNTVFDGDDVGTFILHTNSGNTLGTILAQSANGRFGFGPNMTLETTYHISYVVGNNLNGAPDLSDPCLSVASGQPVIFHAYPDTDAGVDQTVCGLSASLSGSPANGIEVWSVISGPNGALLQFGTPQNIATVANASMFGVYLIQLSVSINGCTALDTLQVVFGENPTVSNIVAICDATNSNYSINFNISGGQAPYQVNSLPIAGSSYTSSPIAAGAPYQFNITDSNGCVALPVSGSHQCTCTTNAGVVSLSPQTLCATDSILVQTISGQILDANDVAGYVLHTSPNSVLGVVIAQNTSGSFGFTPGMFYGVVYYISAIAGNDAGGFPDLSDPCLSVSPGQAVMFLAPPTPNAGADLGVCGLSAFLNAGFSLYPGTWSQVSGPGAAIISNSQNNFSAVSVVTPGSYVFRWTELNGTCPAFDEVTANFWESPQINALTTTCNNTNTGYTIEFSIDQGLAPYSVNGLSGTLTGNTFTSSALPSGSAYAFTVRDANGCFSNVQTVSFTCPCTTFAGTMDTAPGIFCADQAASATWNNDAMLDGDDSITYILHSLSGSNLGIVYATNDQPFFNFEPGLLPNTTYYISAVAGSVGSSGAVNLTDPCLHVSPGRPIQWKALPEAFLSGDATICAGSSTVLSFNGIGAYPLSVQYVDQAGNTASIDIPGPGGVPVSVAPAETTEYRLLQVSDGSAPTCSNMLNQSVTVVVNEPVSAGDADSALEFCLNTGQLVMLGDLLTGADAGGQWTETSVSPSGAGAFNAANGTFNAALQLPGSYTFKYTVSAVAPCLNDASEVQVLIHPNPVADAGADVLIYCQQDTAILGGNGSSGGVGISYRWIMAGDSVGNGPYLNAITEGVYQLEVTNAFGCTDSDQVELAVDDDLPEATDIVAYPVRCHGETNGSILVGSIQSGHPPVLVSLNGAPFTADTLFETLSPGAYQVILQDANGCEWASDTIQITEPAPFEADLGGVITVMLGDSVTLDPQIDLAPGSLAFVEWSPLLDTLHAQDLIQQFLPLKSLYVDFSAMDTNGCATSDRVKILVEKPEQVFIPNVIRPGSTASNDQLTVFGGPGVRDIPYFRIFDRWGEQLFEMREFLPNDPSSAWDGNFNGKPVSPGVYVFVALVRFIDGTEKIYKGDVTVVR